MNTCRLHRAINNGDLNKVREAIDGGDNLYENDLLDQSPLDLATYNGNIDIANELIAAGVDINRADLFGDTPLHNAISNNKVKMISFLISKGVNLKPSSGKSYIHSAINKRSIEILKMLLSYYSAEELNSDINHFGTPLHHAAVTQQFEIVKLLLDAGIDKTIKTSSGNTASMITKEEIAKYIDDYEYVEIKDPGF